MIIKQAGKILPGFHVLYPIDVPVYLLEGDQPVLFDAGFSCLAGWYADQTRKILPDRDPEFCFITHSHFDHLGGVSVLKKHFPGLKVCAHEIVGEILKKDSAVERIRMLNSAGASSVAAYGLDTTESEQFEPFCLDRELAAGED